MERGTRIGPWPLAEADLPPYPHACRTVENRTSG